MAYSFISESELKSESETDLLPIGFYTNKEFVLVSKVPTLRQQTINKWLLYIQYKQYKQTER